MVLAAIIEADVQCIRCGYNLRGLASDGACPECGAEIQPSFDIHAMFRRPEVRSATLTSVEVLMLTAATTSILSMCSVAMLPVVVMLGAPMLATMVIGAAGHLVKLRQALNVIDPPGTFRTFRILTWTACGGAVWVALYYLLTIHHESHGRAVVLPGWLALQLACVVVYRLGVMAEDTYRRLLIRPVPGTLQLVTGGMAVSTCTVAVGAMMLFLSWHSLPLVLLGLGILGLNAFCLVAFISLLMYRWKIMRALKSKPSK